MLTKRNAASGETNPLAMVANQEASHARGPVSWDVRNDFRPATQSVKCERFVLIAATMRRPLSNFSLLAVSLYSWEISKEKTPSMRWKDRGEMASFLKEKKLILVLVLSYIAGSVVVEGKGSLQGDRIIFSPLRKGNNYTLTKTKSDWFLSSYDKIAEAVILSLKYSPPYGKIPFYVSLLWYNWNRK